MQQDHPERAHLLSTMFLWDMRHLSPATVQHILVEALDATYEREARELGTFAVDTSGGRTLSMRIWLMRESRGRDTLSLHARWDWHRNNRSRSRGHGN